MIVGDFNTPLWLIEGMQRKINKEGREKETLIRCWWDYKLVCNHYGNWYGGSSKN
jgi:hypothetical protein